MNNKLILSLTTLLTFGAVSATTVLADETTGANTTTDVGVGFKSDDDNTVTSGPFKNNLAMVFRPTSFTFGTSNKVGGAATISMSSSGRQYLVVNDDRPVETRGGTWELKGQMSPLNTAGNNPTTLANASVSFTNTALKKYEIGTTMNDDETDFIPNGVDDLNEGAYAASLTDFPVGDNVYTGLAVDETGVLEAGGSEVTVLSRMKADATKTGGVAFEFGKVRLNVLNTDNVAGKSFTGKINWTLDKVI